MPAVKKLVEQRPAERPARYGGGEALSASSQVRDTTAMEQLRRVGTGGFAFLMLLGAAACVPTPPAKQQTAICPAVKMPVCAFHLDTKESYWNECEALRDGAILPTPGECPIPFGYDIGQI